MNFKKQKVNSIKHPNNDAARRMLMLVKTIMRGTCTWPENQTMLERVVALLIILSYALLIFGILFYFRNNSHDWSAIIWTIIAFMSSMQVFVKYVTLVIYNPQIKKLLSTVRNDFWPYVLVNEDMQIRIEKDSQLVKIVVIGLICSTFIVIPLLTFNLVTGQRTLLSQSEFWFEWNRSPVFELLTIWQWFVLLGVAYFMNGFDLLFLVFIKIYISQIWIVASVLSDIRRPGKKIKDYFLLEKSILDHNLIRYEVVIKFVEQHNLLIQMFEAIKSIYSLLIIVQFSSSLMAITSSCVIVTIVPNESVKMVTIIIIMLSPLFLYCWLGSQLQSEALLLSDAAYQSNWEQFTNKELQKSILLIIKRAQQKMVLSGADLINLNLQNFLKVMKFSFSVYTLMQTIINKKE